MDDAETLGARFLASFLSKNTQGIGSAVNIDRAGQTGIQQSDGVAYSLPDFKATGNITYRNGGFTAFLQGRYIGSGTIENALVEGVDIESNHVGSAFYLDLRLSQEIELANGQTFEVYCRRNKSERPGSADHALLQRVPGLFEPVQSVAVRCPGTALYGGRDVQDVTVFGERRAEILCRRFKEARPR